MDKLGVIVPYRARWEHLQAFKKSISDYLTAKGIDFELIIIEQDHGKLFNRGMLLNIGFLYAQKLRCNYVVFHDADMLPINVDYSYSAIPVHLASQRASFDEYFGGVTMFPVELFKKINGYSNEYWGWGFEDDDLLYRCQSHNLFLDKKEIKIPDSHTAALRFNGMDSQVKATNKVGVKNMTVLVSFEVKDLILDYKAYDDEFVIFSLPKINLKISYDSFQKYKVTVTNSKGKIFYINSERSHPYKTNLVITLNENVLELYQDGESIGFTELSDLDNNDDNCFYLGDKYQGLIHSLAMYNEVLHEMEIKEISQNKHFGLTQDFGNYKNSYSLKTYYDAKFIKNYQLIDLSGHGNKGHIYNCELVPYDYKESEIVFIPVRRESEFDCISHSEGGYVNGSWKDINTRYNQLRYANEVIKGHRDEQLDGLSNLKYKEHSHVRTDKQTHVIVGI